MPKRIKILAIDGGGIRGVIPAMLMAEIEKRTGKRIAELFDLITGTSTGGILALGAVKPAGKAKGKKDKPYYRAEELLALYETEGGRIFYRSPWRSVMSLGAALDEKYPTEGIESVLQEYFGETMISEAIADVIIPSYEIEKRTPFFFKSRKAQQNTADDFPMWQAARATSAAPSFFEPIRIKKKSASYALADGGVVANNPAMCAYAEVKRIYPSVDDMLIVSLGTGDPTRPIPIADAMNWGFAQWLVPLVSLFLDGMGDSVDYQLRQLLPDTKEGPARYYRLQPLLAEGSDNIDDASRTNIRVLKMISDDYIREHTLAIDEMCAQLTAD